VIGALSATAIVVATATGTTDCSTSGCRADVSIEGSAIPSPITPATSSSSLLYFYPKNNGPGPAYGITVHLTVPYQLRIEYARDYSAAQKCTVKGTFVSCYFGDFKREQEGAVVIKVHPRGIKGTYEIPANVYSTGVDDPNGGNNQVTATLAVYQHGHGG
jgi:hypothetical protein